MKPYLLHVAGSKREGLWEEMYRARQVLERDVLIGELEMCRNI